MFTINKLSIFLKVQARTCWCVADVYLVQGFTRCCSNRHLSADNLTIFLIFMILWTLLVVATLLWSISSTFFFFFGGQQLVSGGSICFFLVGFVDLEVTPKSRRSSPNWLARSSSLFHLDVVSSLLFGPYQQPSRTLS